MRYELKSIGLWPFIKISFFANLILGFVVGLLYALFFSFIVAVLTKLPGFQAPGLDTDEISLGVLVIFMPIMFAILGAFFNTILGAGFILVYNALARMLGGLELDLAPMQSTPYSAVMSSTPSAMSAPPFGPGNPTSNPDNPS